MTVRPRPILFFVAWAGDAQRLAIGPALASIAQAAGWGYDAYSDDHRRGRHFGGDALSAAPGAARGSTSAGAAHAEQLLWLTLSLQLVALGDPRSSLWPVLEAAGAEILMKSNAPAELYAAALERLGVPCPASVIVLDDREQGAGHVRVGAYTYPSFLSGPPVLGLEASAGPAAREALERLGVRHFEGAGVAPDRAALFPGGLDGNLDATGHSGSYATLTAWLARRHAAWAQGLLLGDPELVADQLPKARRLRLVPIFGRPQTEVITAVGSLLAGSRPPVYGRQYDDRDFELLSRRGQSFQLVDPGPPFDSSQMTGSVLPHAAVPAADEPCDDELRAWAAEGRVLTTLLLWSGMVREVDCIPRLLDLVTDTGLRAGLILTVEAVQHLRRPPLDALATPVDRGGVAGRLELLLGSTGHGAAFEGMLPNGRLEELLASSMKALEWSLPAGLRPRGWWPLLDTHLEPRRRPVAVREGRWPAIRLPPRHAGLPGARPGPTGDAPSVPFDLRRVVGTLSRAVRLDRFVEPLRPYDGMRPALLQPRVARAVRAAGFSYMWTKAAHGTPMLAHREGEFVALPFTAGSWDGWTPFYTASSVAQLDRAERRLTRRSARAGWLAATIDAPLWATPVDALHRGHVLHAIARRMARGGAGGRLVNVTPNVVARYARILDDTRGSRGERVPYKA